MWQFPRSEITDVEEDSEEEKETFYETKSYGKCKCFFQYQERNFVLLNWYEAMSEDTIINTFGYYLCTINDVIDLEAITAKQTMLPSVSTLQSRPSLSQIEYEEYRPMDEEIFEKSSLVKKFSSLLLTPLPSMSWIEVYNGWMQRMDTSDESGIYSDMEAFGSDAED